LATTPVRSTGEQERAQRLLALGFDEIQSLLLATTGPDGEHVDLQRVARMLADGCPHVLALRILT